MAFENFYIYLFLEFIRINNTYHIKIRSATYKLSKLSTLITINQIRSEAMGIICLESIEP